MRYFFFFAIVFGSQYGLTQAAKTPARSPANPTAISPSRSVSSAISEKKAEPSKTKWSLGYAWSVWTEDLKLKSGGLEAVDLANYQSTGLQIIWASQSPKFRWGVGVGLNQNTATAGTQNVFNYKQSGYSKTSYSLSLSFLGHLGGGWFGGIAPVAHFRAQKWISNLSGLDVEHTQGIGLYLPVRWIVPLIEDLSFQQDIGPVIGSPYTFLSTGLHYTF